MNVKTLTWIIEGVEFEATNASGNDLEANTVQNPNDPDRFFFSEKELQDLELSQLVESGYLVRSYPWWICKGIGTFTLTLTLDGKDRFPTGEEVAECQLCGHLFPFTNDGSQLIQTYAGCGPAYSHGGLPPEYEPCCDSCRGREEEWEPEYEWDEDMEDWI